MKKVMLAVFMTGFVLLGQPAIAMPILDGMCEIEVEVTISCG